MEESIGGYMEEPILQRILGEFNIEKVDIRTLSPLTLAYIGDSIYDFVIKTTIVEMGNKAASSLHKSSSKLVNAETQSKLITVLLDSLTEEEEKIYKRGRNAKSYTTAKNASISDYRKATGFEALLGYLYLDGNLDRGLTLIHIGMDKLGLSF